jgi:hypothetical protein
VDKVGYSLNNKQLVAMGDISTMDSSELGTSRSDVQNHRTVVSGGLKCSCNATGHWKNPIYWIRPKQEAISLQSDSYTNINISVQTYF